MDSTKIPVESAAESETTEEAREIKYKGYSVPCIVETLFTQDVIVADVVATDFGQKNADPTGKEDSTNYINQAIQKVYNAGGGTVFLPSGTYKVTGTIQVLPFVSLVGDYDPAGTGETGTIILALEQLIRREKITRLRRFRGSMPDFQLDLDTLRGRRCKA